MKIEIEKQAAKKLARDINSMLSGYGASMKFMEVCGTHTMAIHSSGIKSLFTSKLMLVSGPGCPVCVTEKLFIDQAIFLGKKFGAHLVTFGDLIRGPGHRRFARRPEVSGRVSQGGLLSDGRYRNRR